MKEYHISSSEGKRCKGCGHNTGNYKTYEHTGIQIRIPLCDSCYNKSCVKEEAMVSIKLINRALSLGFYYNGM